MWKGQTTESSKSLGTNSYIRIARKKSSYSVNTDHRFNSSIHILLIQYFQFNLRKSVSNQQME